MINPTFDFFRLLRLGWMLQQKHNLKNSVALIPWDAELESKIRC